MLFPNGYRPGRNALMAVEMLLRAKMGQISCWTFPDVDIVIIPKERKNEYVTQEPRLMFEPVDEFSEISETVWKEIGNVKQGN